MENLEYWVWLQAALGAGNPKPEKLLEKFGSVESIYRAGQNDFLETGGLTKREMRNLCDKSLEKSERVISNCMEHRYEIVPLGSDRYPEKLRGIYAAPCVLYICGEIPQGDDRLFISVVGTRQITEYGYEAATRLSMGIAAGGAVVVSGLALGVDGAAHKGALKAGGKTVAVLGCGLDIPYPVSHTELKRLIAANGAVVTEYPPGARPDRLNFPMRNRIIAGLSQGTLVVEAGAKSGALITASLAAEMGRDIFAVPGSIFSPVSEGTNRLIKDGAKPACNTMDILEEYMDLYPHTISLNEEAERENTPLPADPDEFKKSGAGARARAQQRSAGAAAEPAAKQEQKPQRAQSSLPEGLTENQRKIYWVLRACDDPVHVDELAIKANLELRVVLAVLTSLEIQGLARSYPGRRYTA